MDVVLEALKPYRSRKQFDTNAIMGISKNSPNCSPPEGIKGRKTKSLGF
jgi:hypothetical protein